MKKETKKIKCPKCGNEIDVNEILYHQLQQEAQNEFDKKYSVMREEKKEVEKMKSQLQESVEKGVVEKLSQEKLKLEKRIRLQITEEKSGELNSLEEQLAEKVKEAKELNKIKADFIKVKREKDELREKIEAESELKLSQQLQDAKQKIYEDAESKSHLKIAEKENVIEQLRKQLKLAQQKAEQGSMQLQGEVAEIELEKILRAAYPNDDVREVPKGVNGADIIAFVKNIKGQQVGVIAIESKRTKSFSQGWIDKMKSDQRLHKADLAILVSEAMPKDMTQFGLKDGVWVCTFQEFVPLLFVLRDSLIRLHDIKSTEINKTDKMSLLYSYLTSQEFAQQITAIVESFTKLKANLETEKKAMFKVWKEREKTIDAVAQTTVEMYGSIKSIAGNSVKTISALELPMLDDKLSDNHI